MNVIKVIKLDFLSVKPYLTLKNLIVLILLSVIYAVMSKNSILIITIAQMFAILFSSYPFIVGEESGIDPLYRIFSIKSEDVVKGRYLVGMLFVGLMLVVGLLFSAVISYFYAIDNMQILLLVISSAFFISTIIIFIDYPIYFKFGYAKGKLSKLIMFIFIVILNFFQGTIKTLFKYIFVNQFILIVIWIVVFAISFRLSNKFYLEKDF